MPFTEVVEVETLDELRLYANALGPKGVIRTMAPGDMFAANGGIHVVTGHRVGDGVWAVNINNGTGAWYHVEMMPVAAILMLSC